MEDKEQPDKEPCNKLMRLEDIKPDEGQVEVWINTPFAYARVMAGQSKLEQDILLQVSEHIQSCMKPFFELGRDKLPDRPNSLFYGEARIKMQEPIRVTLADYGIKPNHYDQIRKAVESILNIKWVIPVKTSDGVAYSMVNVFSRGFTEFASTERKTTNKGYIDFYINPDMADYAFDMSLGYVQHPRRIARNSDATHTTMLYMLIKHHCGKRNKCRISLLDIKKHLELVIRDPATDQILEYTMSQYNQFKKRVLDKVQKDLDRMAERKQTDFTFTYTEIRNNGKTKGDPAFIEFTLVPTALGESRVIDKRKTAAKTKLINTLIKRCGDLRKEDLIEIVDMVKDEDLKDFTQYAYKQLPALIEKFYPEDVAGYIKRMLRNWIESRANGSSGIEPQPNLFSIVDDEENRRKEEARKRDEEFRRIYPGRYADEYKQLLERCSPEYREWLLKARHVGGQRDNILINFPDNKTMDDFEKFESTHDSLKKEFMELYNEIMGGGSIYARFLIRGWERPEPI